MKFLRPLEDLLVAATFAEKNQHDYAHKLLSKESVGKQTQKEKTTSDRKHAQQPQMRM